MAEQVLKMKHAMDTLWKSQRRVLFLKIQRYHYNILSSESLQDIETVGNSNEITSCMKIAHQKTLCTTNNHYKRTFQLSVCQCLPRDFLCQFITVMKHESTTTHLNVSRSSGQ